MIKCTEINEIKVTPQVIADRLKSIAKRISSYEDDAMELNFWAESVIELTNDQQSEIKSLRANLELAEAKLKEIDLLAKGIYLKIHGAKARSIAVKAGAIAQSYWKEKK